MRTNASLRRFVGHCAICATGTLLGCSGDSSSSESATSPASTNSNGANAAAFSLKTGIGHFEAGGLLRIDGKLYTPLTPDYQSPIPSTTLLRDLPIDELAKAISPVVQYIDGQVYRPTEPDYELALAIKSGRLLGAGGSQPRPAPPASVLGALLPLGDEGVSHVDYLFSPLSPGHPETTNYQTNDPVNNFPNQTIVYLQGWTGAQKTGALSTCTGTYVGAHTLLTAAHCMYDDGNRYSTSMVFTPGTAGHNGNPEYLFYGQYGPPNNNGICYTTWLPGAWGSQCAGNDEWGDGCAQYDYAVVDFRQCGNPTINLTGWMGIVVNLASFASVRLDGYPAPYSFTGSPPDPVSGTANPACGSTANPGPNPYFPFLCGMSGPGDLNSFTVESDTVNQTPGDSGGPWWEQVNSPLFVCKGACLAAVHSGQRAYPDFFKCGFDACYRNFGHAVDGTMWNFITTVSEL